MSVHSSVPKAERLRPLEKVGRAAVIACDGLFRVLPCYALQPPITTNFYEIRQEIERLQTMLCDESECQRIQDEPPADKV